MDLVLILKGGLKSPPLPVVSLSILHAALDISAKG